MDVSKVMLALVESPVPLEGRGGHDHTLEDECVYLGAVERAKGNEPEARVLDRLGFCMSFDAWGVGLS